MLHLIRHLHFTGTINASECNAIALWSVSLVERRDRSVNFFCSRLCNSGGTWLSLEVGYKFVNTLYSVCRVCRFLYGISMIYVSILGALLTAWSLAGIAIITISSNSKIQIRWAVLYFFTICLCQVAWSSRTTRSQGCLGFSIEIKIVGFGVDRRLYSVSFSTTQ